MVLSGTNTYTGATTANTGFLQAVGDSALGAAIGSQAGGTIVNQGGVLELNGVTLTGENLQLNSSGSGTGLYDVPGAFSINAQNATVLFGTGELRAVGNSTNTWTGNVELRSTDNNGRWYSIGVDTGSSLTIDGVLYGVRDEGRRRDAGVSWPDHRRPDARRRGQHGHHVHGRHGGQRRHADPQQAGQRRRRGFPLGRRQPRRQRRGRGAVRPDGRRQ
jgi:hypothetical protein